MNKYVVRYYYKDSFHYAYFKTLAEASAFAYGVRLFKKRVSVYEHSPNGTTNKGVYMVLHGGVWKMIDA